MTEPVELDPHWEWVEIRDLGDREPQYVRGQCNHLDVVSVESVGVEVARLCLTCDQQLPALIEPAPGRS